MSTQDPTSGHEPSGRILAIAEREVGRIILDIHDGPVQNIYAALSQLYVVQRRSAGRDQLAGDEQERIRRSVLLLEHALSEIRTFIGAFRPPEFERRELVAILEGLVIQHEELSGNPVRLLIRGDLPPVTLPVKISLYRILQEALSNAVRHGQADSHTVTLSVDAGCLAMEVRDAGRGFDPSALQLGGHFGLDGMRERVRLLGGSFSIQSAPGRGTVVRVELPCA